MEIWDRGIPWADVCLRKKILVVMCRLIGENLETRCSVLRPKGNRIQAKDNIGH